MRPRLARLGIRGQRSRPVEAGLSAPPLDPPLEILGEFVHSHFVVLGRTLDAVFAALGLECAPHAQLAGLEIVVLDQRGPGLAGSAGGVEGDQVDTDPLFLNRVEGCDHIAKRHPLSLLPRHCDGGPDGLRQIGVILAISAEDAANRHESVFDRVGCEPPAAHPCDPLTQAARGDVLDREPRPEVEMMLDHCLIPGECVRCERASGLRADLDTHGREPVCGEPLDEKPLHLWSAEPLDGLDQRNLAVTNDPAHALARLLGFRA